MCIKPACLPEVELPMCALQLSHSGALRTQGLICRALQKLQIELKLLLIMTLQHLSQNNGSDRVYGTVDREIRQNLWKTTLKFGIWNVRTTNQRKIEILARELDRNDAYLTGISDMRWTGNVISPQPCYIILWQEDMGLLSSQAQILPHVFLDIQPS